MMKGREYVWEYNFRVLGQQYKMPFHQTMIVCGVGSTADPLSEDLSVRARENIWMRSEIYRAQDHGVL